MVPPSEVQQTPVAAQRSGRMYLGQRESSQHSHHNSIENLKHADIDGASMSLNLSTTLQTTAVRDKRQEDTHVLAI
jgi:hypothetical protein